MRNNYIRRLYLKQKTGKKIRKKGEREKKDYLKNTSLYKDLYKNNIITNKTNNKNMTSQLSLNQRSYLLDLLSDIPAIKYSQDILWDISSRLTIKKYRYLLSLIYNNKIERLVDEINKEYDEMKEKEDIAGRQAKVEAELEKHIDFNSIPF